MQMKAGELADALRVAGEAAAQLSGDAPCVAKLVLAHALLLNNRYDEARNIYQKHKGKTLPDGRKWEDACREDFRELREAGCNNPNLRKIEQLLGSEPKRSATKEAATPSPPPARAHPAHEHEKRSSDKAQ